MFALKKGNEILYIMESEPSLESMNALGCDSFAFFEPDKSREEIIADIINGTEVDDIEKLSLTDKEIGKIIVAKKYQDNPHAQIADLAKFSIKAVAVFSGIIGKEQTKQIFSAEIEKARQISDTRVLCGLEPFDLSFLD